MAPGPQGAGPRARYLRPVRLFRIFKIRISKAPLRDLLQQQRGIDSVFVGEFPTYVDLV